MRIAHFVQRYPPALGGSEAFFARLGRYLAAQGDQVSVFTTNALDLEAFWFRNGKTTEPGMVDEGGVEVRRYPLLRWPGRRYWLKALSLIPHRRWQALAMPCNPLSMPMWWDAGRTGQPFDVVHATAFPYAFPIVCGLRLARRLRVPFLLTPFLHLGNPSDPADRTRKAYLSPALLSLIQAADHVFVQTELERQSLVNLQINPEKLLLLGMGVDETECTGGDRQRIRKTWGMTEGEVVVGHLANKSIEKGTVDLLRAAEIAWRQGDRFRLVLAGPEMPNFVAFWNDFSMRERVVRLPVLTEREKRDFFSGLDLFALPSRSDSFGMVLLEAWANGTPNLGYRAGGIAEVIRHDQDGMLVECGDVTGLARAITTLASDSGRRRQLGECGHARIATEFGWEGKLRLVRRTYGDAMLNK